MFLRLARTYNPQAHEEDARKHRHLQMITHSIGTGWSLLLAKEFQRRVNDGDVVLIMPARTIYASVFNTSGAEAEEAIQKMIEGRPGIPVQLFDRDEPALAGHAYLLPETDEKRCFWGLNTWTAVRGSVACVTIYFEDLSDLDWAISVWKSVRPREAMKIMN